MVAETPSRGSRFFPEISIYLRTGNRPVRVIRLPPVLQLAAGSVAITALIALSYFGISRIGSDRLVAEKEAAVLRAETANADLQDEIASLRDGLAAALRDR